MSRMQYQMNSAVKSNNIRFLTVIVIVLATTIFMFKSNMIFSIISQRQTVNGLRTPIGQRFQSRKLLKHSSDISQACERMWTPSSISTETSNVLVVSSLLSENEVSWFMERAQENSMPWGRYTEHKNNGDEAVFITTNIRNQSDDLYGILSSMEQHLDQIFSHAILPLIRQQYPVSDIRLRIGNRHIVHMDQEFSNGVDLSGHYLHGADFGVIIPLQVQDFDVPALNRGLKLPSTVKLLDFNIHSQKVSKIDNNKQSLTIWSFPCLNCNKQLNDDHINVPLYPGSGIVFPMISLLERDVTCYKNHVGIASEESRLLWQYTQLHGVEYFIVADITIIGNNDFTCREYFENAIMSDEKKNQPYITLHEALDDIYFHLNFGEQPNIDSTFYGTCSLDSH